MPVEHVTDHILLVVRGAWGGLTLLSGPFDANAYLLRGGEDAVLVDCGAGPGTEAVAANVHAAGIDPIFAREIVLTHLHTDHSGGAAAWQRAFGARVSCHPAGAKALAAGDLRLVGRELHPEPIPYTPSRVDRILENGAPVRAGAWTLRALHTPGHTPDLLCLRGKVDGADILVSSDCAIGNQGEARGCVGWLDGLWRSNVYKYADTLPPIPKARLTPGDQFHV